MFTIKNLEQEKFGISFFKNDSKMITDYQNKQFIFCRSTNLLINCETQ